MQALLYARDDLFDRVRMFVESAESDDRHLFLFADSGMGKTTFLINFFAWEHRLIRRTRWRTRLISLANRSANEQIRAVPLADRKTTNLFLDALDEDQLAIGRVSSRISEIFGLTEGFRRVVITCRTQFFESDDQIPESTGVARVGPTPARRSKHYSVRKLYLSPFDETQVKQFLVRRFPGLLGMQQRRRARELVKRVPSLSVRPMLLAHMPDLLDTTIKLDRTIDVYEAMIEAWAMRERDWIDPSTLRLFSAHLAIDLFFNKSSRGGEFAKPEEITRLANALGITVTDDRLTARSLLNRTSEGNYKFAHRSILEYLVAIQLKDLGDGTSVDITDQMANFLLEVLGCESLQRNALLDKVNFHVALNAPERRLGYLTNFSLYQTHLGNEEPAALHSVGVSVGGARPTPLSILIRRMVERSFRTEMKSIRSMRIHAEMTEKDGPAKVYISVWVNSYGVLCEGTSADIVSLIRKHGKPAELNGLCFSAENAGHKDSIEDLPWSVHSRIDLRQFPFDEAEMPQEEPPLLDNPSVGVVYDAKQNRMSFTLIEGVSRTPDELGTFARFGIFGPVKPMDTHGEMTTVGPVRIGHFGSSAGW